MNFKQWLLESEGSADAGISDRYRPVDHGWDWDLIYPSTAGDFPYDIKNPKWFWWYQWRLERGQEIGRTLYNIDPEIINWKYVAPYSKTAPDDKPWVHKSDDGSGSLGVKKGIDLVRMGFGPSHDKPLVLQGPMVSHGFGSDPPLPPHTALGADGKRPDGKGFKDYFNEVHYTDLYSRGFEEFRKKYNKIVRNKQDGNLYVQFTDYMTQSIDRTPWRDPDHSDPVAIYGYPLRYVIQYPADIWYGQTAKYLRVLKNKARNPLNLFKMTEWEAENILMRMGLPSEWLKLARKDGKFTGGSNQWAQAFIRAVQLRYDLEPEKGGWGMKHYAVRSGQEQTQLFLKAGYDALIDTARSQKQAAINDREPEQIAFLTRHAFEVVEVFPLRIQRTSNHSLTSFEPERDIHGRKLAAIVFEAIGDRLVSGPVTWNWGSLYWSAKGKRAYVNFDRKVDMNLGWGEKQHKALKLSDASKTVFWIEHSERGKVGGEYYSDTKFKDIVEDVVADWNQAKEIEGFVPETKEMWEAATKRAKDEELRKRIQKEKEEKDTYNKELRGKLGRLKKHLGLDVPISDSVDYEHLFDFIARWVKAWMRDNKEYNEQGYESAMEALDAYFDDSDKMYESFKKDYEGEDPAELAIDLGYLPRVVLKERPELAAVIKLLKEIWSRWPDNIDSNGTFAVSHALRQLEGDK